MASIVAAREFHDLAVLVFHDDGGPKLAAARRSAPIDDDAAGNSGRLVRDFTDRRSEEHTSELQSLMRNSYPVFCLKNNNNTPSGKQETTKPKNANTTIYTKYLQENTN